VSRSAAERGVRPSLAWLTIRITAVLLAILVLAHFAVTHLLTDVAETDSAFVAARWQSGVVAATDWLMLVAAVLHGGAGTWAIVDDYVTSRGRRLWLRRAVAVCGAAMIAGGTTTLVVVLGR
jgi:succinate dehydrogenase / fumarate reductase membrane anchor subunit